VYLGIEKGYFKEEGVNIDLVPGGPFEAMFPALASGQIDVLQGGVPPSLFNGITRGLGIKIVADTVDTAPGRSLFFVVRKDLIDSGAIKDYVDFKGKTLASQLTVSGVTMSFEKALAKAGLKPTDANFVTLTASDMVIALANKKIDVAGPTEPQATQAAEQGVGVKWRELNDVTPGQPGSLWVFSAQFIKSQPDAAKRFMVGMLRGNRDYENGMMKNQNREEVIQALIKYTTGKDRALYDKIAPVKLTLDGDINVQGIQGMLDFFRSKNALDPGLDLSKAFDTSFSEYAIQRLGKYTG